ncbi:uncharacterized protein AMSG_12392 [Thecamonas trahens ATCC 50062]|uniref:Uncharacterized protein n=1 Tax=Thecamonas trahens ATCC 50062 TaxID=461836 RepID=A0A0L0DSL8_THETB|nr:hypothetical protein AMSG_12392 [Thecamonas trahens ATCC 50062]KNC55202.1 hypothetical protein AMSG_12392 [Thecamonas trahens ATCC 50062]|eukprot:XP_013753190.1 hypothetical protein AMSG_12392 [Thecamonas trahens ATCC 50062]
MTATSHSTLHDLLVLALALALALAVPTAAAGRIGLLYSYASDDACQGTPWAVDIIPDPTPAQCTNSTCWGGGAQPFRQSVCVDKMPDFPPAAYPLRSDMFRNTACSGAPWVSVVASDACVRDGAGGYIRTTCNATVCFNQPMSGAFALMGLASSAWVYYRTSNTALASGIFFFFTMEALQFVQYFYIDDCESDINRWLTLAGFLHICLQPYFTHVINASLTTAPKYLYQYDIIKRLCLLGGGMLFARYFMAEWNPASVAQPVTSAFGEWAGLTPPANACVTSEWLRGEKLCTYSGKYHLAWSVPMSDPTYWTPGAAIHSFLMFGPFFVMKWDRSTWFKVIFRGMIIQGAFLFLTGPYMASWVTDNLQEQASIWCFVSIAEITWMLFVIREKLILGWGRDKEEGKLSAVGPAKPIKAE